MLIVEMLGFLCAATILFMCSLFIEWFREDHGKGRPLVEFVLILFEGLLVFIGFSIAWATLLKIPGLF